jgi:YidC/Oxa1 family membrane protein insertase
MNNMMTLYMPIFLGYITLNYASGLAIYFITTNVIGIAQYAMLGKVNWRNVFPFLPSKPVIAATETAVVKSKPRTTKPKSETSKKSAK